MQTIRGITAIKAANARGPRDWVPIVSEMFGYKQEEVSNALWRLLDYAMVAKIEPADENAVGKRIELLVTAKGDFVESLAFSDPATLYHMALFAPYCHEIWNESCEAESPADSRLFGIHVARNPKKPGPPVRQWWSALLRTSITFLRHLHHFDAMEQRRLRASGAKIGSLGFGISQASVLHWYRLPSLDAWYAAISSRLTAPTIVAEGKDAEAMLRSRIRREVLIDLEETIAEVSLVSRQARA